MSGRAEGLSITAALGVAIVGGLLFTGVHPLAPVALAAVVVAAAYAASSAYFLMLSFMAVLFLRPAEFFPFLTPLKLGKLAAVSALGLWALGKMVRQELWLGRSRLNLWMGALVAAVLASSFLGTWPAESMRMFQEVFIKVILLYVLIVNLVDSPRRMVVMQVFVGLLCAVLGYYALYAKFTGISVVEGTRAGAVGLIEDPNDLAFTLLMATPFLLYAMTQVRGWARRALFVLLFGCVAGIISTQSRGGILGLGAGMYLVVRHRLKSRLVTGLVLGAVVGGLFLAAGVGSRQGLEEDGLDQSADGRLNAWRAGIRMFRQHPVLGVGFERFPDNFFDYTDDPGDRVIAAHNSWVKAIAETGLAGFIPFMALVILTLWIGWRTSIVARDWPPGLERAVGISMLANTAAVLVSGFFLSQTWNWFLYILFAQAAAAQRVWGLDRELVEVKW